MQSTYSEDCSALAFYGVGASENAVFAFYECMIKWFQQLGYPPDKIAIGRQGRDAKWTSFLRGNAKLQQTGFVGITNIEMVSLVPEGRIPVNDYLLNVGFFPKHSCATFVSRSSIVPLKRVDMLPVAKCMAKAINPAYGIGYTRQHRQGPAMYAVGICQGLGSNGLNIPGQMSPKEEAEADRISNWGNGIEARVWDRGLLRDIYPWNFLSASHVRMPIGTVTLEQWITEDVQRGQLVHLDDQLWFWEVPAVNLGAIRKALQAEDIIFDWTKHLNS